jgi:arylsulfatase A-like enzyme
LIRALALLLCLAAGCSESSRDHRFPGCDLLFISIDTLRADRLPAYGYRAIKTPALDRLVDEAVLFSQAQTQAMVTAPSHMTMFTSVYPRVHRVGNFSPKYEAEFFKLPGSIRTLAEVLREKGFRTAAFTDGGNVSPLLGFNRGFEFFDADNEGVKVKAYKANEYLKKLKPEEKVFLFLHTYEVHDYIRPKEFAKVRMNPGVGLPMLEERASLRSYDERIERCDEALEWLFERLDEMGRLESMLIVFTSDHGETFYEHGHLGHFQFHREVSHVPLIVRLPGGALGGGRVEVPVGLVDLMPTLLDLMDLKGPATMQGVSLLDLMQRKGKTPRPVLGARLGKRPAYSVLFKGHKLIMDPAFAPPLTSLYDVTDDPDERTDVSDSTRDLLRRLRAIAEEHLKACDELARRYGSGSPKKLTDPEIIEELRKLGY